MVNVTATVSYTFEETTYSGSLDTTHTPISIGVGDDTNLSLSHKHLLACYLKHENTVIYHNFDQGFNDWVSSQVSPVMTYTVPVRVPNQNMPSTQPTTPKIISYVPDEFKKKIRSIIKFIVFIHSKDFCMESFESRNLVIKDNKLKFWNINFISRTFDRQTNDFRHLYNLLDHLFENFTAPDDMHDLASRMLSYTSSEEENLFLNHIAVLTSSKRMRFFNNLSRKQPETYSNKKLYDSSFGLLPITSPWNRSVHTCPPLEECFNGTKVNPNSQQPQLPSPTYTVTGRNQIACKSMFRFISNAVEHVKDVGPKFQTTFFDFQIDAMIVDLFWDSIVEFQKILNDRKLLDFFRS